jgi:hypothetical protein
MKNSNDTIWNRTSDRFVAQHLNHCANADIYIYGTNNVWKSVTAFRRSIAVGLAKRRPELYPSVGFGSPKRHWDRFTFPQSVPFHQCSILIYSSLADGIKSLSLTHTHTHTHTHIKPNPYPQNLYQVQISIYNMEHYIFSGIDFIMAELILPQSFRDS